MTGTENRKEQARRWRDGRVAFRNITSALGASAQFDDEGRAERWHERHPEQHIGNLAVGQVIERDGSTSWRVLSERRRMFWPELSQPTRGGKAFSAEAVSAAPDATMLAVAAATVATAIGAMRKRARAFFKRS